jgi:hypothetical protein
VNPYIALTRAWMTGIICWPLTKRRIRRNRTGSDCSTVKADQVSVRGPEVNAEGCWCAEDEVDGLMLEW